MITRQIYAIIKAKNASLGYLFFILRGRTGFPRISLTLLANEIRDEKTLPYDLTDA